MKIEKIYIHCDGGARGNPGPAAFAFVVDDGEKTIFESSSYIGHATNNIAEYGGVVAALSWIVNNQGEYGFDEINFLLDSELVVNQMTGRYKVKNEKLRTLFTEAGNIIKKIEGKISFTAVRRDKNKRADMLLNQVLDRS